VAVESSVVRAHQQRLAPGKKGSASWPARRGRAAVALTEGEALG
jgi:hypothetical protein